MVFLFLSIPCFHVSNFFFKLAYTLQQRKLVSIGRKCRSLGGEDYSLKFNDLRLDHCSITETYHSLYDFARRLERSSDGSD